MLVLSFLVVSCAKYDHMVRVSDVQKQEVITLKNEPKRGEVHGISIRGRGTIDGEARIDLMLNGSPYKTERLSGKVNFSWGGDWYSDTAEIRYEPIKVSAGELWIQYRFSTLS